MSRIKEMRRKLAATGVRFATLGDVAKTLGGLSGKTKADFSDGSTPYVSYKNVFSNLVVDQQAADYVRIAPGEKQNRLHEGDVLFTGSSENLAEVGMSSVVASEPVDPLYLNSFCFVVRFQDPGLLLPAFSKHLFRSASIRSQIQRASAGVTRINLSKERFMRLRVPVPPLDVQAEIARVLDLYGSARTTLDEHLDREISERRCQWRHYRSSLLTFAEASGVDWAPLGDIAINHDSRRRPVTKAARVAGDIPYYGASGVVDYVNDFIFDGDYLLVSEDGANLLARTSPIAFSVSGKSWVNNHAHVLEFPTSMARRFAELYLNSIDLATYVSGGAQPKLNQANLNRIPMPMLSVDDQARIATTLDSLNALVKELSSALVAERLARRQQYEYHRDHLLTFVEANT